MRNAQIAQTLVSQLALDRPPVGLAFVTAPPASLQGVRAPAPSACSFWRRADQGVFYASATDHYECPIGAMTMGFDLPPTEQPKAEQLVATMASLSYFDPAEVAHLPTVKNAHRGIVYGPLADLPIAPDIVLLVASPYQAMLLSEAEGAAALGARPSLATMGRPACAAIPQALQDNRLTLSLGCIGARTYAELPPDRVLVMLPAARLEPTVARLEALVSANTTLAQYHSARKAQLPDAPAAAH